jgi:peptidoglycan hydrolase CwlO-like protein
MTLEPRLPPRPLDGRVDDPADLSGRDAALDQRNDTLWDLVVHLRDYVEQLRSERHTLREEAQMLRDALAEAVEEVRVLRASQLAANSNEQARTAADNPSADPNRLGTAPKRLH